MHLCPDEIVALAVVWSGWDVIRTFGGNCVFRLRSWVHRRPWTYLSDEWLKQAWRR